MDETPLGETPLGEPQILDITPIYIGIDTNRLIGKGTTKIVYSCIETKETNDIIFALPDDTTVDKLCIAVLDLTLYVEDELEIQIQIDKIEKEIELQILFFEKQLAPKIYEHRFDEAKKMYYILEEKCGSPLLMYIKEKTNQTEDNFNKIVELVKKIADTGYINVDIKPANTCTKFENGLLSEIIALDFDTKFFIKIDLTNEQIKEQGKIFMLTLFIAYLAKKYIVFEKVIVEKHLNCKKIEDMLTFFAKNPEICAKEMHPLFMLYYYIINSTVKKNSCSDINSDTINKITRIICSYIFPTKAGGSRKSRRPRRSKKSKKSKKSRK